MVRDIQDTVAEMKRFLQRRDSSEEDRPQREARDYRQEIRDDWRREERMADPLQLAHLRSQHGEQTRWTPHSLLPKSPWAPTSEPQPWPASFKSIREQRTEPKTPYYMTNTRRPLQYTQEEEEEPRMRNTLELDMNEKM